MSVIKDDPLNTPRPNVVPAAHGTQGMFDITANNSPPCPKCRGPARLLVCYSGHVQRKRTRCNRCGDTPLTEPGQLVNVAAGFTIEDVVRSALKPASRDITRQRGPCRRCGCTRVGKFCAGCGIQDGDIVERRRRPRTRSCWWRRHCWEYIDQLHSMGFRACRRCGLVQQERYSNNWLDVPGEMARKPLRKSIDTAGHVVAQRVELGDDGIVRTHIELEGHRPVGF